MAYLLSHLLSASAARSPEREAVRYEGAGLSYAELDRITDQLGCALHAAGVRRGDRVGILVAKSLASVASVFGILKAGAVYVPLDPLAPAKRIAYIMRNCDVKVIVTSTTQLELIAQCFVEGTPLKTAVLTDSMAPAPVALPATLECIPWERIVSRNHLPVCPTAIETDLAYILYTSGSTGDPKGVMISHRTIFTFINWCHETFRLTENDRVTSHAPLHFDLSTFDIFATIKVGGTVVLVPEMLSLFPARLSGLLESERVTVTYLVPSILSLMVNYGELDKRDLSALRAVLFAGEVFPIKYLRKLVSAVPQADYYNLYGPTETNVCTYYKVNPKDLAPELTRAVPIGIACENVEVFAVDEQDELVKEPGQEGEMWVRGSCVAHGYWGDPVKTARSFVRNRFQAHFDEPAYRTGDIVTLDSDGVNWVYVGRRDHMIKSRGYRIELGEIESALYGHGGVKEAAVVAVPDELIGNRIKAFVVPLKANGLTATELQAHCGQRIPRYMIPETIEFKDELPRTSNGKINRPLLAQS